MLSSVFPSKNRIEGELWESVFRPAANFLAGVGPENTAFPMPQPHSLTSKTLEMIRTHEYIVQEKTDGIAVLVCGIQVEGAGNYAFLVSRTFDHAYLFSFEGPVSFYEGTCLFGEFVINAKADLSAQIHVFDVNRLCGISMRQQRDGWSIVDRLAAARKFMPLVPKTKTSTYKKKKSNFVIEWPHVPLFVKPVKHKADVEAVYKGVHVCDIDGLIFSPLSEWSGSKRRPEYKWKQSNTVDFLLSMQKVEPKRLRNKIKFLCGGVYLDLFKQFKFAEHNVTVHFFNKEALRDATKQMQEEMKVAEQRDVVIECAMSIHREGDRYNASVTFSRLRPDKHRANTLTTITSALCGITVNFENVVSACTSS